MSSRQAIMLPLLRVGVTAGLLLAGCNAIFGVDDLRFDPIATGGTGVGASTVGPGGIGGDGGGGPCTPGDARSCYSGPTGTDGVGTCMSGSQICGVDGMTWGPCSGEVVPAADNCATTEDENCDGHACGDTVWAIQLGDGDDDEIRDVTVLPDNTVVVVGTYAGALQVGSTSLPAAPNNPNAFVAWISADGQPLDAVAFSGSGRVEGQTVAADAAGNLLVGGAFVGGITVGGSSYTAVGGEDAWVAKLDAGGTPLWSFAFGSANQDNVRALAALANGDVLMASVADGFIFNFGGMSIPLGGADYDYVLARLMAGTGSPASTLWNDSPGTQLMEGVVSSPDGSYTVGGYYQNEIALGSFTNGNAGGFDVFVARVDALGVPLWLNSYGDTADQRLLGLALDSAANSVITGFFNGAVDFGGGALPSPGAETVFIAKIDSAGQHVWSKSFGNGGFDFGSGVAVDGSDAVWVTGRSDRGIDFGSGDPNLPNGLPHLFVVKLDAAGNVLFDRQVEATSNANPPWLFWQGYRRVAVGPDGGGVVAGYFHNTLDFAPPLLTSTGGADAFVAKFAP